MHTAKKFFQNAIVSIALSALVTAPMLAHAGPQAAPVVSPQAPAVQQAPQTQTQQLELIEKMQLADVSNETAGETRAGGFWFVFFVGTVAAAYLYVQWVKVTDPQRYLRSPEMQRLDAEWSN